MAEVAAAQASEPVRYWLEQIEGAQKWHDNWHTRGKDVNERYLDKGETAGRSTANKMNVLWSNVQTIQPALYAKTPSPKVQRRFRDKDPVGRWAATVIERAESFELDAYDDDYHFRAAILDYLLPGRGQVWVYYEPKFSGEGAARKIEWECCRVLHLHWRDFLTNPARTWDEVWWVAKRSYVTKEEAKAQRLNHNELVFTEQKEEERPSGDQGQRTKKAAVWEIWDKLSGKVYFVSRSSAELLRKAEPPGLRLDGFFPCPRPLTTTTTTDSILPVPDYCQYQNQAREIDKLTQRIDQMTDALRVVGMYDAAQEELGRLFDSTANTMIPCATWAVLASQGGIEGSVDFFPLKEIIEALQQCYVSRDQAKQVMYEITGISDIVRGASDPDETLGAQQIKTQWGGLRIRDRQTEVQRFIRDTMRIKAEIYAEVFQPDTLRVMSNVPLLGQAEKQKLQQRKQASEQAMQMAQANPELAQQAVQQNPQLAQLLQPLSLDDEQKLREPAWEEVVALLRDEKLRGFRIDIETDSTILGDEEAEKKARSEFLTAMTSFITTMGPIAMQAPKFAPLFGEMMLFGARAFKAAESLESAIEEAVDALSQQALLPQPEQAADPKMELEGKRQAFEEQKFAHEQQAFQSEQAMKQSAAQDEQAFKREELQGKSQQEIQMRSMEAEEKVRVAEAARPQIADTGALGPIMEMLQQALMSMAQQNQQAVERNMQMLQHGLMQIAQIVAAPKQISVSRDGQGRIAGGTAAPILNGPAAGNA